MLKKRATVNLSDVNTVKKRFLALNRERLMRAQLSLRERQRNFLEILPLLFHINHPSLPGFISKNTPTGVSEYRPSDKSIKTAKKFAKTFSQKRRALMRYDILSLFLMGSSGTVAYSKKSDFDIWICHQKDIDADRLEELRLKGLAIEEWAMSLDLEVHFFLVEPESFSQGVHEDISAESSGSAQHYLLMEEFYRTGLLLAGRYPLWWLVPPTEESNYDAYVAALRKKRFISESECVDFGALPGVPAEEFFGAALWQLYKGIDSPYKSVLKLLLMESYAHEYPDIELLCHRFKKAIYQGEISLDQLDPYIMLYTKLEDYLVSRGEEERLALLRRCFYFKVNEPLSVPIKARDENWRRDLMVEVTQSWDWSHAYLEMLDARQEWKIERVVSERAVLVKALTYSYRFLSDFAREHAQLAAIKQSDLNVLGRKLYAAFERKAGKVEIINRGISNDLWESHLSFYRTKAQNDKEAWLLFKAPLNVNEARKERPLRRSHSLIELLAWCHFNSMLNGNTVLAMHSPASSITARELKEMFFSFQRLFPADKVLKTDMEDFASGAKAAQVAVFVNLGVDPMLEYSRNGKHLMSDKNDALSYGGLGENLALCFDMITITTWKEVLTSRYTGVTGLLECLRDYLRWSLTSKNARPPEVNVQCYSTGQGITIRQRIEELFGDIAGCFCSDAKGFDARYVLAVETTFYILSIDNNALTYERASSFAELLHKLGSGNKSFSRVVVDRQALTNTILPSIFAINKARALQVFYQTAANYVDVYVLDERGSLFYQRMAFVKRDAVLTHFSVFFDSVLNRQYYEISDQDTDEENEVEHVEFYEIIHKHASKTPHVVKKDVTRQRRLTSSLNIQVIGEIVDDQPMFTIYCDDKEFSSIEYDADLFKEVARYVLAHRRSGERYPIYITDMDLPHAMVVGEGFSGHVQTIHFLTYKRRIEKQLNEALAASQDGR